MNDTSGSISDGACETPAAVRNQGWWAPVPEALILDPDVSHLALRVWCVLRRHGDSPENCYPSHRRVADLLGVSPRSIARPLKDLESAGWIERFERRDGGGSRLADGYVVRTERSAPDATEEDEGRAQERTPHAGQRGAPTQDSVGPPRRTARYIEEEPEPLKESHVKRKPRDDAPQRAPSTELAPIADASSPSATVSDQWERFWSTYPKKVGKQAARKAWDRARKRRDPDEIQAALEAHLRPWATFEAQFIPNPATWLSQGRYEDPAPMPRTASARPNRVDENMAKIQRSIARMAQ